MFLLFPCSILNAQQWHFFNPTAWFDINTIELLGPGIIAIGGGQESHDSIQVMFQSSDYGLSWYENAHDGPSPWTRSMAFSDSVSGLAVGYGGKIIRSDDAGRNWGHNFVPVNRNLNKIVYAGSGIYYVAGGNKSNDSIQTILKSSDNGNTWDVIYDTLSPWLRSVYFLNTLKGFAVGDHGVVLATTDGGNSWSSVTVPVLRDFHAITFTGPDTGYIAGGTSLLPCHRTLLQTIDGGLNWTVLTDDHGGILKDISFMDAHTGYIVGDSATVLKTIDGGMNWAPLIIGTSLTGNESFNAVRFYSTDFGAIAGKSGKLYIYGEPLPIEVQTGSAYILNQNQVVLHARINTHTQQAEYGFYYSTDSTFASSSFSGFFQISCNSWTPVTYTVWASSITKYYYYSVVKDVRNAYNYGDTLTFSTVLPYSSFNTLNAQQGAGNTVILHGTAEHVSAPMNMYFEYGISNSMDKEVQATPSTINDLANHSFTATIDSLEPFIQYNCRLKGVSATGVYCGNNMMFSSGAIATDDALILSGDTVVFRGNVQHSTIGILLYFEYGTSSLLGSEISASPFIINDTTSHSISAVITSLNPDSLYFYRLKGVGQHGTYYGNLRTFFNGRLYNTFRADDASNVSPTSATLKGTVDGFRLPATYEFDYCGNNYQGCTSVMANPSSIYDTLHHTLTTGLSSLRQNTFYNYRLRARINSGSLSEDSFWSNTISFFTGTLYQSLQVLPPLMLGNNSAILIGNIRGLVMPASIGFEYGATPNLGYYAQCSPPFISDTASHHVTANIFGLTPGSLYYCRVCININGVMFYSDMISFYCVPPAYHIETFPANDITLNSSQLNGIIDKCGFPVMLKFEYGTSASFGNTINATPESIDDTLHHNVSAEVTGLLPNTFYYYRFMASNQDSISIYGNVSKFYTADCEIPNCSFEEWDEEILDKPLQWNLLGHAAKVESYNGSSAMKLGGGINMPGIIVCGDLAEEGTSGGFPFNALPDSLVFHASYNITPGDTAFVMAIFKVNGTMFHLIKIPITGNSGGNFKRLSYPSLYSGSLMPDSMIIGVMSSNVFSNTMSASSQLIIDDISFTGQLQGNRIPNSDFENWESVSFDIPVAWCTSKDDLIVSDSSKLVRKSNEHVSGGYSVLLMNRPSVSTKTTSVMSGSTHANNNRPVFPVSARHETMNFYFKFIPENNDSLYCSVTMFSHGNFIGNGFLNTGTPVMTFIPAVINIHYMDTLTIPDSAYISFSLGSNFSRGNSQVWIDQMSFDGFRHIDTNYTGIAAFFNNMQLNVYPNPSDGKIFINYYNTKPCKPVISIFDIYGKLLYNETENKDQVGTILKQIELSGYPSGIYLVRVTSGRSVSTRKLIIQKE